MKNLKTVGILAGVLIALGLVATWDEWKTKKDEKAKDLENKLISFDPAAVKEIKFFNRGNDDKADDKAAEGATKTPASAVPTEFTAVRKDGIWRITSPIDYAGDSKSFDNLLTTLKDYKYDKVVAEKKEDWTRFGIDTPRRTLALTLAGTPDTTISIAVGQNAAVGYHVYSTISTGPNVYIGSQYLAVATNKTLVDFRDKTVLKIDEKDLSTLVYEHRGDAAIEFQKQATGFMIMKPEALEADNTEVRNFIDDLNKVQAADFIDLNEKPDPILSAELAKVPFVKLRWTDAKGVANEISFVDQGEKVYSFMNPNGLVIKLQDDFKKKLVKKLVDFRNRKVFSFEAPLIVGVEIDGQQYKKISDDWYDVADAGKFDKDGKFTGKKEDQPMSKSNIRSLLVDLEFAKADEIVKADSVSSKLSSPPTHRVKLLFAETSKKEPLTVDAWALEKEEPEHLWVRHTASPNAYKVSKNLFDALKPASATLNQQGGSPEDGGSLQDELPQELIDEAAKKSVSGLNN